VSPSIPTFGTTIEDHSVSNVPTAPAGSSEPTRGANDPTIVLANDGSTDGVLVNAVWAQALAAKGIKVRISTITGWSASSKALKTGQIDVFQYNNGSLLQKLDTAAEASSPDDVDAAITPVLPAGLTVLDSTPADDNLTMVVNANTAEKLHLTSIADLESQLSSTTLLVPTSASLAGFRRALSDVYGLTFPLTQSSEAGSAKTVSAIVAGDTVGRLYDCQYKIADDKLVTLTDPEHLFIATNFIPVVTGKVSEAMRDIINVVSAKLTVTAIRGMERALAIASVSPTQVADAWLNSAGLN